MSTLKRLHKLSYTTLLTAWIAALTHSPITSADQPSRIIHFITIDVAPWAYLNKTTGEPEGAFVEIVNAMSSELGAPIHIDITPFARVERELTQGIQDCTILVPLQNDMIQSGEVVAFHPVGLIPNKSVTITRYEDLSKLKISVIRGASITEQFDNDTSLNKEIDTDYAMGLRKVARGRLDAIVGAIPTLQHLAEEENLSKFLGTPYSLVDIPLVLQCAKNTQHFAQMSDFNQILQKLKDNGTIAKIQAKYHF